MADSDPPDEIQNVHSPTDGNVHTPFTDADEYQLYNRQHHQLEKGERNREADEPANRRLALQNDRADLVGHRAKRQLSPHDRMRRVNRSVKIVVSFVHGSHGSYLSHKSHMTNGTNGTDTTYAFISGFGFRNADKYVV